MSGSDANDQESGKQPCCDAWAKAQESGTDNEGWGPLVMYFPSPEKPSMGSDLPAVRFCPWCGSVK